VYLLVYVDDILMVSKESSAVEDVKRTIRDVFDIRELGQADKFLGMKILRDREQGVLKLSQEHMVTELIKQYGTASARVKSVPLPTHTKLTKEGTLVDKTKVPYMELVGSLLYLAVCTRPDIAQAVGALSKYMSTPTEEHWRAAQGVVQYLAGTTTLGITYTKGGGSLLGYCDADYAGDVDSRRSTTGYIFTLSGGAISWSSRLQPTVAASTAEAEYMAAAYAVKEALWLRVLATDLDLQVGGSMILRCDNKAALTLLTEPIVSARTKHIDILHHFARERAARGEVTFEYCPSEEQVADILTKPLTADKFKAGSKMLGLH
jgi:Reverse transcriptase (RNA-dependent DNA polymerase)